MVLRNESGMSVTELMVSIAITGVLAAVAIPCYLTYVQQARVVNLVFPPLHAIEMNVALHFSMTRQLPGSSELSLMLDGVDAEGLAVELASGMVKLAIDAPAPESKLHLLDGEVLIASPIIARDKISGWHLSGALADRVGLSY